MKYAYAFVAAWTLVFNPTLPSVVGADSAEVVMAPGELSKNVASYLAARSGEFDRIPAERRESLERLSAFIRSEQIAKRPVRLVFVCTHNSRRSHMAQIWAAAAAKAHGFEITTYSGGTETTAFNPRAVDAMTRAGCEIEKTTEDRNSIYHVRLGTGMSAITCFSKVYDQAPNPSEGFGVVMVCDDADEKCPHVAGATARFAIPYVDPKVSDGTPQERETYDERSAQIAREMMYVMSRVSGSDGK